MFQRIDFTKAGGFPLTQDTMGFLQNSYNNVLEAVSHMAGQYIILSGVTESGGVVSNGWVTYDGEIIPFEGGVVSLGNVAIVEIGENEVYRDGNIYTVQFSRKAILDNSGSIPLSAFKPLSLETLNNAIIAVNALANTALSIAISASTSTFSTGMIMMWSGAISSIPTGWRLCDGTNGTPDLKGKFIVGYSTTDTDYNLVGNVGGEKTHTLLVNEMPSHNHGASTGNGGNHTHSYSAPLVSGSHPGGSSGYNRPNGLNAGTTGSSGVHSHAISSQGGGDAHENRPPYYVLAYIYKT